MSTEKEENRKFELMYNNMNQKRWWITIIVLTTFAVIVMGIIFAIIKETPVASEWKELLLVMLGAFLGTYNKAAEFWFGREERDKLFLEKIDDEDDESKLKKDNESNGTV